MIKVRHYIWPCSNLLEERLSALVTGEAHRLLARVGLAEILERVQLHKVGCACPLLAAMHCWLKCPVTPGRPPTAL